MKKSQTQGYFDVIRRRSRTEGVKFKPATPLEEMGIPDVKYRDAAKHLKAHGCTPVRQTGSHEVWQHPSGTSAPIPKHSSIKGPTFQGACKTLGIHHDVKCGCK